MIVDFRRNPPALPPLTIMNSTVTAVESFGFLGTTISQDLKWDNHIDSIVKNAQQRLYFLRQLRKFNLPQELLKQFYSAIIESVLCTSITVWFSSATKSDLRRLRRVVRTAERIIGTTLPTLQELYLSRVSKRAGKITLDPSYPAHSLFELLPSGRRYTDTGTVSSPKQSISWTLDNNYCTHTCYALIHLFIWHTLVYISIAHNIHVHTKLSTVIRIPVHTIVNLYIVIPYLLVLFNSSFYYLCFFCSVTVILLHYSSFCHENKFLVCVNIPDNKAHSDSDSDSDLIKVRKKGALKLILSIWNRWIVKSACFCMTENLSIYLSGQ